MANKKRSKKSNVLYHRLILVIAVLALAIYLLVGVGIKTYETFFQKESEVEQKENTKANIIENKEHKKVVVIDPGHGGYDPGSESQDGSILEKDVTLKVALATGKYIEANNDDVLVVYTRDSDDYYWTNSEIQDLQYRVDTAIENDAALFLSIHLNSNDESVEIRGHETWVSLTSQTNEVFAYAIDEELNALNYNSCRGVKDQANSPLIVLNKNPIPSALVELGYINNHEDLAYINSDEGVSSISKALGKAVLTTLDSIQ